jgi:FixJ family two-component response regulator
MTTVCVVDDDLSVRKSLVNLLKSAGYRALSFESGEALLTSPELDDLDCIVLDLRMNGLHGLEVQRSLAATSNRAAVICMSAHWDSSSFAEATGHGAFVCLHKPFTGEALLSVIEQALQTPRWSDRPVSSCD